MELPVPFKILILDDNAIDRETCRRHLSNKAPEHYVFVEHNSIDGAIECVRRENPHCILLDYHLHDGTGVEFLGLLAEIGGPKRYPVVMLTGTGSETIAVQVMKAGAQDYLIKDRLNPDLLQRTVESAIYKAQTERLLDEQRVEMERLFREAQEANARKDQFLAALSHELRTPLTPVLAAISAVDVTGTDPGHLQEIFAIIRRNIELEARLIDDMLDLTRISRGKLEVNLQPVDLPAVLRHAAEACEAERAAKNIRFEWRLEAARTEVPADSARVQQVFWNLLKNAVKFTPEGGRVTILARDAAGGVEVRIIDTGIGLRPDTEDRIFDAFEQGDTEITRRFGGLGLGLAISKALVEAHGGRIRAANRREASGAVFAVFLPAGDEASARPKSAPPAAPEPEVLHAKGTPVLLVEDHADSAFFLKRMLDAMGYEVAIAGTIAEALEIFRRDDIRYVVSDLGLPDGSGTELMERIREIRPVPAVALSGYGMESDVQRSLDAGFALHLTKPTDFNRLAEALKTLAQRS